jgi:hypothetical protein
LSEVIWRSDVLVYLEVGRKFTEGNGVDVASKSMLNGFMIISVELRLSLGRDWTYRGW